MKKLFKSYLKLFFRKWLETLMILVFLIIFLGTVIGFVSTPLQLQTEINMTLKKSSIPNTYLDYDEINFSKDFVEKYFLGDLNDPHKANEFYTLPNGIKIDHPMEKINNEPKTIQLLNEDKINKIPYEPDASSDEKQNKKIEAISWSISQLCEHPVDPNAIDLTDSNIYYNKPQYVLSKELTNFAYNLPDGLSLKTFFLSSMFQSNYDSYQIQLPNIELIDELTIYSETVLNNQNVKIAMVDAEANSFFSNDNPMKLVIISGRAPKIGEIAVAPIFLKNYDLHLNQRIKVNGENLKIVGTAIKYDKLYAGGQIGYNNRNVSQVMFLNSEDINNFYHSNAFKNSYQRVYRVYTTKKETNISKFIDSITTINEKNLDPSKLPSYEYKAISIITTLCILFIVLGVFIVLLSVYFVLFTLRRDINNSRPQLGILKAIGYRNGELTWIFVLKTYILMFLGVLFGYGLSCAFQLFVAPLYAGITRLTYQTIYHNWIFLLILIGGVPAIFSLLSYFVLLQNFHDSALSLINKRRNISEKNIIVNILKYIFFPTILIGLIQKNINKTLAHRKIGFSWRIRYLICRRDIVKFITVMALIGFTSLSLITQFNLKKLMNGESNSKFISYKPGVDIRYKISQLTSLDGSDKDENKFHFNIADQDGSNLTYNPKDLHFVNTDQEAIANYEKNEISNQVVNISTNIISKTIDVFSEKRKPNKSALNPALLAWATEMFVPFEENKETYSDNIDKIANLYFNEQSNDDVIKLLESWMQYKGPNLLSIKANDNPDNFLNEPKKQFNAFRSSDMIKYIGEVMSLNSETFPNLNNRDTWQRLFEINDNKVFKNNDNQLITYNPINGVLELVASLINSITDDYDPYIIPNTLFYSRSQDFLSYEQNLRVKDVESMRNVKFNIYDSSGTYGLPENVFQWSGSAVGKEKQLQKNDSNDMNVIISKLLAKTLNVGVGDPICFETFSNGKPIDIKVKIIGINNGDTSNVVAYADLTTFVDKFVDTTDGLSNQDKYLPIWNQLFAKRNNFVGKINVDNLNKMATNIRFTEPSININMDNDASLFATITNLDKVFSDNANNPFMASLKEKIKLNASRTSTILNNFLFNDLGDGWDNFPIEKAIVSGGLSFFMLVMTIFMSLNIVLMFVLLFVIVNSIVDDLQSVILMFKSLGYKTSQITRMIFGNYVIWTVILFAASYLFAQLVDYLIVSLIWKHSNIIISFEWSYKIPLISLSMIAAIIGIGFFVSLYRVIKLRPTLIAN